MLKDLNSKKNFAIIMANLLKSDNIVTWHYNIKYKQRWQ